MASPATAFASNVLPVPGGPTNRTPLGILAPSFWNFLGFFKKSISSDTSSFSSFKPATSENLTLPPSADNLALLLPKSIDPLLVLAILIKMKYVAPTKTTKGTTLIRM